MIKFCSTESSYILLVCYVTFLKDQAAGVFVWHTPSSHVLTHSIKIYLVSSEATDLWESTETWAMQSCPAFGQILLLKTLNPDTSIPYFSKVCIMPLLFYQRPTLVPIFINRRKSEQGFIYTKKVKSENSTQHLFCSKQLHRQCTPRSESGTSNLLLQDLHSAFSASSHQFWLCEYLCLISGFVLCVCIHLLTRCVLRC